MSKVIIAAAFAVGFASLFGQGAATADPYCNGTVHRFQRGTVQCYYLPTVANGRVTGVQERTNVKLDYYGPHNGPHYGPAIGGAAIGSTSCRFLPTVVNGRVTGTHQVC
jgi:hypothetical protein